MYSAELCKADFTQSPKVFDSINMVMTIGKFVFAMLDPIMPFIPVIHKTVVGLEAVGIDHCTGVCFAPNNGQQFIHRAVFDDLGINFITSFEHPENGDFTLGPSPSDPANTSRSEVALVELDFAVCEGAFGLAHGGDSLSKFVVNIVNRVLIQTSKFGRLFSLDIEAKKTQNTPKFLV